MKLVAIAALAYFCCLQFVFPGYFHPLTPHHDDFYFPPGLSYDGHSIGEKLQWPRPMGFLAMQVLGKLGLHGYLLVLILITLANTVFTMALAQRIFGQPVSWLVALAYCILLFAHPGFYLDYLHDAFGTLSYLYLILAMHAWYHYRQNGRRLWTSACGLLLFLIAFTKETYFISALVFWMIQIYLCRGAQRRMAAFLFGGCCAVFTAGLVVNAHSMTAVLHVRMDAASPYSVTLAPAAVARGFRFYASRLFHPAALALVLSGIAALYRRREEMIFACALAVAGAAALLPYSVLPNHLDSMYAWTGAALAFSPVLFLSRLMGRGIRRTAAVCAGAAVLVFLSIHTSRAAYEEHRWAIAQEEINRNILASFPVLKRLDGSVRRILVSGLDMPFQPFHTPSYIRAEFGAEREWTVLIPERAAARRDPPAWFRPAGAVRLNDYDAAFGFTEDGRLLRQWTRTELHQVLTQAQADRILFPGLNAALDSLAKDPANWDALLRAGVVYLKWGELERAEDYLKRSAERVRDQNPYPAFFLGQVREAQGRTAEAREYYAQAVTLDPKGQNPAFREALERVRER